MTKKFGILEKDEVVILKYWLEDLYNNILKIPKELESRINKDQATKLFAFYQDLENNTRNNINTKEMENRVKELESKLQKEKEESFWSILKKEFKGKTAKIVVWIIMSLIGFVLGFLFGIFF